jgi:dTDP-4-amino-4,6-dideoxygalactose transaminase
MKVLFNNIGKSTNYLKYVEQLYADYNLFRKKHFSNLCINLLQKRFPNSSLFLTHSATGALEEIALLLNLEKGDEIIMPSFTFVSTANAFFSKGAIPVFVDIDSDSLNLDLDLIENAITSKTKAIVAVHYAGHACDLNKLKLICQKHSLFLIEDAAMAFGNNFENQPLGSVGDFGIISFDITKQISAIQGGLLLVNNSDFQKRAANIYHIGTNREDFFDGNTPYYEWVDVGSKFQMNELNAAALYDQLINYENILAHRQSLSAIYFSELRTLILQGKVKSISDENLTENYHEFYILLKDNVERDKLKDYLALQDIESMFHYIPLHNSTSGKTFGKQHLPITDFISETILRLPLHIGLTTKEVKFVCEKIKAYFHD